MKRSALTDDEIARIQAVLDEEANHRVAGAPDWAWWVAAVLIGLGMSAVAPGSWW